MQPTLPKEIELQESTLAFLNTSPKKLLITGGWVNALDNGTFPTINPATGEVLVEVVLAGPKNVARAVHAGWASKIEGTTIPISIPNQFVYTLREPVVV